MKCRRGMAVWALALSCILGLAEPPLINLETALRLAGAKSLSIELAQERVREARSLLDQDRHQLFPWVGPGIGYKRHDGNVQNIAGDVFDASKQSGTAAVTLQAQLDFGESLYRVLAAKQSLAASEAAAAAQRRETILGVAAAYTELCRATAGVSTTEEAARVSTQTLEQIRNAVTAGLAFAGDAQRAEVQLGRNEAIVLEAKLEARLASARLAQWLRLPPAEELRPDLAEFVPVVLVATNQALDALVASALARRPELRRADASVGGAQARLEGAVKGPWWPTLGAQAAFGGLSGGRNGGFGSSDDFQDYGLGLSWRIGPGGIGDRVRIRTSEARLRIAELEREQLRDSVTREVVELRSRAETASQLVVVAARNASSARRLVELSHARKEFGIGVVRETLEAEREQTRSLTEYLRAVANHNRCQWEYWHVTGQDTATAIPAANR